jgi:N-carbamoylputrescine amidase
MVTALRIAFVEWPDDLAPDSPRWGELTAAVAAAHPDILITNELPFGPWLAEEAAFSPGAAQASVAAHEAGLEALSVLGVPAVISSRPIWRGERLANEAFVLEGGVARPLHRKQYFPDEPGWYESGWYGPDGTGFEVAEVLGIRLGVLLCTEAMFNEHARGYGRQGASLIVIPRASGTDQETWRIAGAMAALASGAYVVSSNRVGPSRGGVMFGGGGFAYAPRGRLLAATDPEHPILTFELEPETAAQAQRDYPCYVPEVS